MATSGGHAPRNDGTGGDNNVIVHNPDGGFGGGGAGRGYNWAGGGGGGGWSSDGGDGGDGGGFGMDGHNGEHPQQMNNERFIHAVAGTTIDSAAEPRNYGYGGSGGLSIETNGCDLKILSTGNIPASGLGIAGGHRSETNSKSSELYRNGPGMGGYLTP